MTSVKVSDFIVSTLFEKGVRQVFQLSGGMITHLLDSLHCDGRIDVVSVHHEQAAAFAADAAGRMTGIPGVAMATSGPGATNLLTGIGSCYFDSSPAVFITGQVNRHEQKGSRKIRQLGFQETDIVAMATPVTKAAWKVDAPEQVPELLERAFALAVEGRPGPVLVDVPMDVQNSRIDPAPVAAAPRPAAPPLSFDALRAAIARAERPLILAGGGVRASRSIAEFRALADALGFPVVHSLMGVDVLPFAHPLRVGMIGTYGNRWANLAISRSDFLLVLGSRLDVRQTGSRIDAFKEGREIFHVDCEEGEINNRVSGCQALVSNLADFLPAFRRAMEDAPGGRFCEWRREIAALREQWPDEAELSGTPGINPNVFLHQVSRGRDRTSAYIADVGQHQMWAAQSLELSGDQRFFTSGGMGSMGFGLPAAIGAALSERSRPVVLIVGDGAFQCNLQELQTVMRLKLPVKMVILDNQCHGMVRQFQESYFGGRYVSTYWGYSAPDFAAVARAYGVGARSVEQPRETADAVEWLWSDADSPALLQVKIDLMANAYPKIAFGKPMSEMEPQAQPIEMEST